MNLTEPQAGSDVGALRTTALPNADGSWSIKGTKIYITFGEHDLTENIIHLVLARTPDAPAGTKGISLFLVPKILPDGTTNDLRCVSIEHKLGIHASPSTPFLHMCAVAVAGWLMERQKRIADEGLSLGLANRDFFETKSCVSAFFLTHMIPEAVAQKTSAMAGAADLCRLKTDLLARTF